MKTKFKLLSVITLLCCSSASGQDYNKRNTYLDAIEIARIIKIRNSINSASISNKDTIYKAGSSFNTALEKILRSYGNDSDFQKNPFLSEYFPRQDPFNSDADQMVRGGENSQRKKIVYKEYSADLKEFSPSSYLANWQAAAVNSVASFMAERFKQEVFYVAVDQIFKQIQTDSPFVVNAFFPKTFTYVKTLYSQGRSSYYSSDLLFLKQTAQVDIGELPINMIKNLDMAFPELNNKGKIKDVFSVVNYVVEYTKQGESLDHLLSTLANETYSSDSTIYKIINVADLISCALIDDRGDNIWINPIDRFPTSSLKESLEARYFYGLLYQQLVHIPELKKYLEDQDSNKMTSIATKIQKLGNFLTQLRNAYTYVQSNGSNLKSTEEIILYLGKINQGLSSFMKTLKDIPEVNSHYGLTDQVFELCKEYQAIGEALMKNDYQKACAILVVSFADYMGNKDKCFRKIAFISQLASVQNEDEMEALLNSYALPLGSASIKRHSSFNLSVNGYVGLTAGKETAYGNQGNQTRGNVGLSAPIGISMTFCNGYLTPFISVFDLGSVVNQRLNNDTTSYTNLKFEHFFAPGLGVFVNCPKLPVTVGIQFNYIPNLRTIKYESGNAVVSESNLDVTRMNITFLVDIPFFTFYNKEK